ncbi:MAG: ABC transporter ATP-binding protein [Cellulosilyticaceae bacterium]
MEIFHIEGLNFTYPMHEVKTLKNINLQINAGEFVTICGESGCGKTTLIKQLKSVLSPHGTKEGKVFFEGKALESVDLREQTQKIGYVLQNPDNQIVTDKVWHELAFGLESLGYNSEKIRLKVAEMASFFGIQGWFYKNVSELSGGQKQLLNLASIMAMSPDVLVLDEPTSQLDPIGAVDFLETLKKINNDLGTTIIITEHRLEEIFPMTDRVVVMRNGEIVVDNSPKEVCKYLIKNDDKMQYAMPSAIRIVGKINQDVMPLTIREGRQFIEEYFKDKEVIIKTIEETHTNTNQPLVIQVKEAYFRYEKKEDDIIKNLNFSVRKGELYALVGGNGSGKTTTLTLLNKIRKPYRGKIKLFEEKVVTLPQNPQTLFVKKQVWEDLKEVLKDKKYSEGEISQRINDIAELVDIKAHLEAHPYDLSGGEQQRVGLAKVLLLEPQILLLDEPTKGLDAYFKIKLAKILKKLTEQGVTIVMVSHDIEFCASYANRCGMFFDGSIVTENTTNKFFSGNSFYTTSSNRMSRVVFDNAVTVEDVIGLWQKNI